MNISDLTIKGRTNLEENELEKILEWATTCAENANVFGARIHLDRATVYASTYAIALPVARKKAIMKLAYEKAIYLIILSAETGQPLDEIQTMKLEQYTDNLRMVELAEEYPNLFSNQ